jgi:hypothetical protein
VKRLIGKLLGLGSAETYVDPGALLYSLPTISNDVAERENGAPPAPGDLTFHEDDWAQVEFFRQDRLPELQRMLAEFKMFERANRVPGSGWRNIYVRAIARAPVIKGPNAIAHLEQALGVAKGPAPFVSAGRVRNGFTLPLGGGIALYGIVKDTHVPVLGAAVGSAPDDLQLATAFAKLSASDGLVLIDWRQQFVITGTKAGKLSVWRP